jgi:hypothetical protein
MTRQERLESALLAHEAGHFTAPAPGQNQFGWLRAAIAAEYLPDGNLRSYATVLRMMIDSEEVPAEDADDASPLLSAPNSVRRYSLRHAITEGEDGTRSYIFYTKNPFYIKELAYEEMKRAYANKPDGLGFTINQVCKAFGITRKDFQFIRTEMGWTHDQDEFTREEHLELSTGQLLEDREQRSRWLLEQEANKVVYREYKDKAQKWDNAIGRYLGLLGNPNAYIEIKPNSRKRLAIFPMGDFHFEEDDDAERKIREAASLLKRAAQFSDDIVLVFLGDWFNADTYGGTTTAGTRVGGRNPLESVRLAYTAAYRILEYAKKAFTNVDTMVLAGNHDRMATIGFAYWIETVMGRQPWLTEAVDSIELKCLTFGRNQLLFEHGDGAKGKLSRIISAATYRFGLLPTQVRTLYTGHLHHSKQQDVDGVNCVQVPAPKTLKRNDWEEKGCWNSQHGMRLDIYTEESAYLTMWSGGQE